MLIRGVPVERYDKERASKIYWGVGTHLGAAVAAERQGPPARRRHRPGPRRSATRRRAATRSAASRSRSTPTAPTSSGLFCLDAGASGGASLVANAVTIHNDLVRDRARARGRAVRAVRRTTSAASRPRAPSRWYTMPIFSRCDDRLFVRYIRPYIESSRRHEDAPRPSDEAREAMDRSTRCAPTPSTTCR